MLKEGYFGSLIKRPFTNVTTWVGAFTFTILFLFIVSWFQITDVWNNHFYIPGSVYVFYNGFKVIFLFYFCWILYTTGRLILQLFKPKGVDFLLDIPDRFLLSFFVGGAALNLLMFILGYLNLYYYPTAIIITAPILFLSYPHMKAVALVRIQQVREIKKHKFEGQIYNFAFLLVLIFLITLLILISKALFPIIDRDFLTHYSNYYNEVIQNHGIWPNRVWYHYYLSKGSGLIFLSILLTDNQGPQLISSCFFSVSALTLFSLVRKISNELIWPLTTTILYLIGFVYTPAQVQDVILTALLAAMVWMMIMYQTRPVNVRKNWLYLWIIIAVSLVVFVPTVFPFLFLFPGYFLATALVKKQAHEAKLFAILMGATAITWVSIMIINFLTTGLFELTPLRIYWDLAVQEKFDQWISFRLDTINYLQIIQTLLSGLEREKYFPNLGLIGLLSLLVSYAFIKDFRPNYKLIVMKVLTPILVMLGTVIIMDLVNSQSQSLFRFYVFVIFFGVIATVILWRLSLDLLINPQLQYPLSYLILGLVISWATAQLYYNFDRGRFENEINFATGQASFQQAYLDFKPELYPETGIFWPAVTEVKNLIGYDTRLWTFHTSEGIGTVPGQPVDSELLHLYHGIWHTMVFAKPEIAKDAFIKAEINYFLLDLNRPLFGALPYSPLFEPDNIGKYFEIAWKQDNEYEQDVYLLTWRGEVFQGKITQGMPLDNEFIERWKDKLSQSKEIYKLYKETQSYYSDMDHHRVYPFYNDLTPLPAKGWQ